ncbi:MAG TPA: hypothetical protein VEA37_13430 [Flavobacterium sp.]|nr:hypothetical protein [Flavobacterium sp.]
MTKARLFQYAIIWHPTEKQVKDESLKSKVLVELKTILAVDQNAVSMAAAMEIPADKKSELDQIEIVVRPF